jgi:alkylated DNA repair dioxygenase AlkB
MRHGEQAKLFDLPDQMPNGLVYRPDFLTGSEEEVLLAYLGQLPLEAAEYRGADKNLYKSKRRHVGFGWGFDRDREEFIRGEPLPPFLAPLQRKIAKWMGISPARVVEALVNEYSPGSAIGWHRDRERFEHIIGISLGGWARMRFRPLQGFGAGKKPHWDPKKVVSMELEPRSAYIMQNEARWKWQHSVANTRVLRYSITFRTLPAAR